MATEEDLPFERKLSRKDTEILRLTTENKKGGVCGKHCGWITIATMGGACMGTGAFIYASNFAEYGILATGILGPVPFIYCLIIRSVLEIKFYRRTGSWFKEKNSRVYQDGKIVWSSLIPFTVSMVSNFCYLLVMSLGWDFAKASDMNQGVISTLLSLASLFNIITFYLKFG